VVGSGPMSAKAVRLRGGCDPLLAVDGNLLARPADLDDLLQMSHLEAIEGYHGATAPVQLLAERDLRDDHGVDP